MDKIVPWADLVALIEPHYPKGEQGHPPVGLERMVRPYFLQWWFNLSDPGLEEVLFESPLKLVPNWNGRDEADAVNWFDGINVATRRYCKKNHIQAHIFSLYCRHEN